MIPSKLPPSKKPAAAQKQPFFAKGGMPTGNNKILVYVLSGLAVCLFLVMLLITFKSGYSPKPSKSKLDKFVVVKSSVELADDATAALQKKDLDTFLSLLSTQIKDINSVNSKGDTLLVVAATLGNQSAVEELVLAGADVNKPNAFTKDTALIRALYNGYPDIAKRLVYSGATLNVVNNYGHSPLFIALEKKYPELIDLFLISGVRLGLNNEYLFRSAGTKNHLGVLTMLKGGIDPNIKNEKGNTPLIISASLGDLPSVKTLLAYRADLNAANNDGNTPLIYAARYNHPKVIKELLRPQTMQPPVDLNYQNKNGETALYWAASKGYTEVVKRLLAAGADPTISAKDGLVPYRVAQKNGRTEVLEWFNKDFVTVHNEVVAEDKAAMIAQAKAEGRDVSELEQEEELREQPVDDKDIFTAAATNNKALAEKVLAQNKAAVFNKNSAGQTPFLVAVESGHKDIADFLLAKNSRLFETSGKGNAFHIAVKAGNMEMLKFLVDKARAAGSLSNMLEYKVSPAKGKMPVTPIYFAAKACNKEIYDYLVSLGAKEGLISKEAMELGFESPAYLMSQCKAKVAQAKQLQ